MLSQRDTTEFNPYVHGTNSSVFALLPSTEFTFVPPMTMIEKYHVAPFGGEINEGSAFSTIGGGKKMFFARLWMSCWTVYDFQHIIHSYANSKQHHPVSTKKLKEFVISYVKRERCLFGDLGEFLVMLMRLNQSGVHLADLVDATTLENFKANRDIAVQYYYLWLLIGDKLNVDEKEAKAAPYFNAEKEKNSVILEKIAASGLNIQSIYQHPTPEDLAKIEDLLVYPNQQKVFKVKEKSLAVKAESDSVKDTFSRFQREERQQCFPCVLRMLTNKDVGQTFVDELHQLILGMLKEFNKINDQVDTLINFREEKKIPKEQLSWNSNPFPLVLVNERKENITVLNGERNEHVTTSPMKLGVDITMLATNSYWNKRAVLGFLGKHGFFNVAVVTFDELSKCNDKNPVRPVLGSGNYAVRAVGFFDRVRQMVGSEEKEEAVEGSLSFVK